MTLQDIIDGIQARLSVLEGMSLTDDVLARAESIATITLQELIEDGTITIDVPWRIKAIDRDGMIEVELLEDKEQKDCES